MFIHYICNMRKKDTEKEAKILKAAIEVVLEHGFLGLTMTRVAKKANIATGTIYLYYKNKNELLNSLFLKTHRESVERFMSGYSPDYPFKIALKKVWTNYLHHRIEHHETSVFLEQYYKSTFIPKDHVLLAEQMKQPVYDIIERGKKEMLVKNNVDTPCLFLAMLGVLRELADEHVMGYNILSDEKIEKAFDLCWDMIKA